MAQQVKFYSVSALPATASTTGAGGIYFVNGGELYKGSQRFGLGRVTVDAAFVPSTSSKAGQARGDIVVTGSGAGWVFDGTNWQSLGGDIASLQSMWQGDIKTWTAGLVSTAQGDGTYIKQITKDANGKVSAVVSTFATDVQNAVGNGAVSSSSNGVIVSVATTSGVVTSVEVTAPAEKTWNTVNVGDANSYIYNVTQAANGQVSASAKAFPTLATGTADGTVKLGSGADAKVSGWDTVKTDISNLQAVVSYSGTGTKAVTADSGTFTNLTVTDTATFSVTNVSASSLTVNGSTIEQLADARIAAISEATRVGTSNGITVNVTTEAGSVKAVSVNASAFGNVMRFRGVYASTASVSDAVAGDIIVIGSEPTGGAVAGQEYICTAAATTDPVAAAKWELIGDQNTYALNAYDGGASGVYAGASTLPDAVSKAGAAIDTLIPKVSTLETDVQTLKSAVTGGSSFFTANGVTVNVVTASTTAAPTVTLTGVGTAASMNAAATLTAGGGSLPTESAVATYVSGLIDSLAGSSSDTDKGVSVSVVTADGEVSSVDVTVTAASSMGFGAVGSANELATTAAVKTYFENNMVWLDASGAVIE